MIYFIISAIIQSFTLYLLFKYRKSNKEYKKNIDKYNDVVVLKKIPKHITYNEVDPNYQTFYSFIENIKLEKWDAKIKHDDVSRYDKTYSVTFSKINNPSQMIVSLLVSDNNAIVKYCIISDGESNNIFLSISDLESEKILNDILLFVWDYIIEYHISINNSNLEKYKKNILSINKNLKTLNRLNKLNSIIQ